MDLFMGNEVTDGMELIKDVTVASDTSSVTLSGLDGDLSTAYLLRVHYRNPTDIGVCCDIRFNNDSGSNYTSVSMYSYESKVQTFTRTMSAIGFVGAIGKNIGWGSALIYAQTGTVRTVLIKNYEPTLWSDHKGWHWNNISDNITSIVLVSLSANNPVKNGIGAGTRILLFKLKRK
jgi:hypothetical protein